MPRISAASVPGRMGTHSSAAAAAALHTGSIDTMCTSDRRSDSDRVACMVS